ncbi:hypothetical protein [Halalkalibacter oceani]|uniref:hypothetical protein n=1 Tax=Halalkalibacter oceani TaxID=1653776 RepID=UPI003399D099
MQKTELSVLFKKMQRDDKKDVLKFEYRGSEDDPVDDNGNPTKIILPQNVYALVGEMVNIEVAGCECGPVTAELSKANKDSKKVVLDLNLKGDSSDKAIDLYRKAGQNVTLTIEPAQASLLEDEEAKKNDHEGIEYAVDLGGNVTEIKDKKKEKEVEEKETVAAAAEETKVDVPNDDELPF